MCKTSLLCHIKYNTLDLEVKRRLGRLPPFTFYVMLTFIRSTFYMMFTFAVKEKVCVTLIILVKMISE